jgi:hypothetical protein
MKVTFKRIKEIELDARYIRCELPVFHRQPRGWSQWWPTQVDWVIVGGESGPRARPCDMAWIASIVEQCRAAAVPCFVKQLGASRVDMPGCLPICRDPKGGDPNEWPEGLRVRDLPEVRHGSP